MIKSFCLLCICLAVAACASQFANRYVGKDVVDLELENGKPTNIVELPDGRSSSQPASATPSGGWPITHRRRETHQSPIHSSSALPPPSSTA
jgi:hypothetical protein